MRSDRRNRCWACLLRASPHGLGGLPGLLSLPFPHMVNPECYQGLQGLVGVLQQCPWRRGDHLSGISAIAKGECLTPAEFRVWG